MYFINNTEEMWVNGKSSFTVMLIALRGLHTCLSLCTYISQIQLFGANLCFTLFSWHWLDILEHMGHQTPQPVRFQLCSESSPCLVDDTVRWTRTGFSPNWSSEPYASKSIAACQPTEQCRGFGCSAIFKVTKDCMSKQNNPTNLWVCTFSWITIQNAGRNTLGMLC